MKAERSSERCEKRSLRWKPSIATKWKWLPRESSFALSREGLASSEHLLKNFRFVPRNDEHLRFAEILSEHGISFPKFLFKNKGKSIRAKFEDAELNVHRRRPIISLCRAGFIKKSESVGKTPVETRTFPSWKFAGNSSQLSFEKKLHSERSVCWNTRLKITKHAGHACNEANQRNRLKKSLKKNRVDF